MNTYVITYFSCGDEEVKEINADDALQAIGKLFALEGYQDILKFEKK